MDTKPQTTEQQDRDGVDRKEVLEFLRSQPLGKIFEESDIKRATELRDPDPLHSGEENRFVMTWPILPTTLFGRGAFGSW